MRASAQADAAAVLKATKYTDERIRFVSPFDCPPAAGAQDKLCRFSPERWTIAKATKAPHVRVETVSFVALSALHRCG
jgi:hypothetical protein